MKKTVKESSLRQTNEERRSVVVELPVAVLETLSDTRSAFFGLCIEAGRSVLAAMMEEDCIAVRSEGQARRRSHGRTRRQRAELGNAGRTTRRDVSATSTHDRRSRARAAQLRDCGGR